MKGLPILLSLAGLLVALKLAGPLAGWNWLAVLAPLWIPGALWAVALVVAVVAALIVALVVAVRDLGGGKK